MRARRGSAVVELALVTPILLLLLLGIVEFARAWTVRQSIAEAARAGARVAAVAEGGGEDSVRRAAYRALKSASLDTARATVDVSGEDGERGTAATVLVGYDYGFTFLGAGDGRTLRLESEAVMRRE